MSKIKKDYGLNDIYKYYLTYSKNPVDKKTFVNFLYGQETCNKQLNKGMISDIRYELVFRAYSLLLPNLGILSIRKKKPKIKLDKQGNIDIKMSGLSVNWKETKRYWENNPIAKEKKTLIYYKNDHSRGYKYRLVWNRDTYRSGNMKFYRFLPVRAFNRSLAKEIMNNKSLDFYE